MVWLWQQRGYCIVSRDILVGAGSFLGQAGANLIAQVASGFATNYFMNENNDFDEIMNNGIFDAIKDLLLDLFLKWKLKI